MNLRKLFCFTLAGACLALPAFGWDRDHDDDGPRLSNLVYVQTNNPASGRNAILAYKRNAATGSLTEIPGSPFLTGGTGFNNTDDRLGPDDTDSEIVVTADQRFLYTVNQGSNTIAGFSIASNGSLSPVPGSPFPSGGVQPGSLGIDGIALYAVNRGDQNPGGSGGSHAPNYTGFLILPNGSLVQLPWSQLSITPGSSPTQALFTPNGRLMFDTHLFETPLPYPSPFPPFIPTYSSNLHSYKVNLIGQLIPADTAVTPAGVPPYILGLKLHPSRKILYTGYVVAGAIGVYSYNEDGDLNFVSSAATGGAGPCWIAITPDAKTLYTTDAITNQVDVFSLADPLHPVKLQTVSLKAAVPLNDPNAATKFDTTPFQMDISPDGKFLYVLNHEATEANNSPKGNALHILSIANDGKLTETSASPLVFPYDEVPQNAHPLGVIVF